MQPEWPLFGRQDELESVVGALRGGGVVLAGAAGVGKTRLAREAVSRVAAGSAARVWWVVATASTRTLPLGAFAHLLPAAGAGTLTFDGLALRDVGASLRRLAGPVPPMIGVDDAHLLDVLSAALLHRLAIERQVRLLVTVRTGEPAPDAVTALWKDGHLARVELPPLSSPDTAGLVERVLDGPVESHSLRRMYDASRGNVLFLRQIVDGALAAGRLRRSAGVWQWRGPAVAPPLAELIQARTARLPQAQRDVLEVLAFCEPVGIRLLATLTSADAVERAEQEGLVTISTEGRRTEARLAHPMFAEVVRETTGVLGARRWRGRMAATLAETGGRRAGDLLRRAVLLLDSDAAPVDDVFTVAARQALALYDVELAERLARAALARGSDHGAAVVLGHALSWQDRPEEAERMLATAVAEATTDEQYVTAALPRAANLFWTHRRPDEGERLLREAVVAVTDEGWQAELRSMGLCFALFRNRPRVVIEEGERLVMTAAAGGRPLPWGAAVLAMALAVTGRAGDAREVIRTQLDLIEHRPDAAFHRVTLTFAELLALRLGGWLPEAGRVAGRDLRLSVGATWANHIGAMFRAHVDLATGRPATAARWGAEAVAGFAGHDPAGWLVVSVLPLVQALGMSGRAAEARRALTDAEAVFRASDDFFTPDLHLARAWTAAAEGAVSTARQAARQAAEVAARSGQLATEVVALHTAVCFDDRTVADRLQVLASQVDGVRVGAAAAHAAALAAGDGDGLDEASARLLELGAPLLAADAAAQACLAHARRGDRARAGASAARATRLATVCEGARTPALRAAARPLPLTSREREIADLVAGGLSNRDIARRLTVSVRTVEGHIYRACVKLGLSSRDELVAVVGAGGSGDGAGSEPGRR